MEQSPIALVTGANKRIGLETVRQLARAGLTVLLGARDNRLGGASARSVRSEGLTITVLELDLTRPKTIAAAASIAATHTGSP
jgi:NAD(P)-dependent dehydrogenase (short-subunit alcohol dehydrogenase family)